MDLKDHPTPDLIAELQRRQQEIHEALFQSHRQDLVTRTVKTVAGAWSITTGELLGKSRAPVLALVRHIVMHILHELGFSHPEIARFLSREHTLSVYADHRLKDLRQQDSTLNTWIQNTIEALASDTKPFASPPVFALRNPKTSQDS